MKFRVTVERQEWAEAKFDVEADTEAQAEELALAEAGYTDFGSGNTEMQVTNTVRIPEAKVILGSAIVESCEFHSLWDGDVEITTKASFIRCGKVEAEMAEVSGLEVLEREWIVLQDGTELEVCKDCHEGVLVDGVCPLCGGED